MNTSPKQTSIRLHYIDVAKGILILMIIVSHTAWCSHGYDIHNSIFDGTKILSEFWNPFIMAAFFVITGFCSNFNKDYKDFLLKDAKTLLLPAISLQLVRSMIVFVLEGGTFYYGMFSPKYLLLRLSSFWFLVALFFGKQIYYFVRRLNYKVEILLLISLFTLGSVLLINRVEERWWIYHALVFIPFLACGENLKERRGIIDRSLPCILTYFLLFVLYIGIFFGTSFSRVPYIASAAIAEFWQLPIILIFAFFGSLMILALSKLIDHNEVLEYFGRNSLVIYCLHLTFMSNFYKLFASTINELDTRGSLAALLIMYAYIILMMIVCSWLLNQKYLKWLMGKF